MFLGLTGLRPEEWIALERGDVDQRNGVVHVRRVFTDVRVKPYGKQERSLRAVPLPVRAAESLSGLPARLDSRLLFPAPQKSRRECERCGEKGCWHVDLHNWRADYWTPTLRGMDDVQHRPPYALRHTYAAFSIAAGVSLFELAQFMGTSVEQIDRTYGHLLPDSIDRTRMALDSFLADTAEESFGH